MTIKMGKFITMVFLLAFMVPRMQYATTGDITLAQCDEQQSNTSHYNDHAHKNSDDFLEKVLVQLNNDTQDADEPQEGSDPVVKNFVELGSFAVNTIISILGLYITWKAFGRDNRMANQLDRVAEEVNFIKHFEGKGSRNKAVRFFGV